MEAAIFGASCRLSRAGTVVVRSPPERSHRQLSAPMTVAVARSESGGGGNRLFVFGTGFVGRYVSDRFISQGWYDLIDFLSCESYLFHLSSLDFSICCFRLLDSAAAAGVCLLGVVPSPYLDLRIGVLFFIL